ncbi:hypothetical protein FA13DRAFT_1799841 [Coprinellus micaceus]|uniref:Uncharacterized protein n=1 Tax=Coprinellus micaceus TaxID=71717 RepID=A0A4Y7SHX2_COPMI|nr:hypothetical protein FA13DRAFT_1799841 [Coprinellus micaceus]
MSSVPPNCYLVQDLYLRELKAYKPAPAAKGRPRRCREAILSSPLPQGPLASPPTSPLSSQPTTPPSQFVADKPTASAESVPASEQTGAEAFLELLEQDVVKPVHHH